MEIVINIPERIYHACVKTKDLEVLNTQKSFHNIIEDAIANGAVLPKRHDRLFEAPTITEADKEDENGD